MLRTTTCWLLDGSHAMPCAANHSVLCCSPGAQASASGALCVHLPVHITYRLCRGLHGVGHSKRRWPWWRETMFSAQPRSNSWPTLRALHHLLASLPAFFWRHRQLPHPLSLMSVTLEQQQQQVRHAACDPRQWMGFAPCGHSTCCWLGGRGSFVPVSSQHPPIRNALLSPSCCRLQPACPVSFSRSGPSS
jgi:hypothetical protein